MTTPAEEKNQTERAGKETKDEYAESEQTVTGHELPQAGEVAHGQVTLGNAATVHGMAEHSIVYPFPQTGLDAVTGADQDHRAHPLEAAHGH